MIIKSLKNKIKSLIESLPYGRDLFLVMFRNRLSISYHGIYPNFEQASKTISVIKQDYDNVYKAKKSSASLENSAIGRNFRNHDYPLLFWLCKLLTKSSKVIELGGSLGHFYYSAKRNFDFQKSIAWQIAEVPEAVSLGEELANIRAEKQLTFIDSEQISKSTPANIFVSSGAIQYMTKNLVEILESLPEMPDYLIIHDLPVHSKQEFWTTQRFGRCEVPYRVFFIDKFLKELRELGFEVKARWDWLRPMEIPFHSNFNLDYLQGFYFEKKLKVNSKKS